MGLAIKKHKSRKGAYKLTSAISDESYHPDATWITEAETKRILIDKAFWEFIEKAIKIDMEFPHGYYVNDRYHVDKDKANYNEWYLESLKSENAGKTIMDKFAEVYDRLGLCYSFEDKDSE
jgi:hypothetical protein